MTDPYERLIQAAGRSQAILTRVGGDGGIASAIARGEWNEDLTPQHATDLADLLDAMYEHVRHARAVAGSLSLGSTPHPYSVGHVQDAAAAGLPLNRKERFYTGTVLPMIVASDGFAHLHRFLALCGLAVEPLVENALDGMTDIQFFSEYNFAESLFTDADKARFPEALTASDTPDLVIAGPDWLLAVEAKMFHDPPPSALNDQMRRQRTLVDYWARTLALPAERVVHALLLPSGLSATGVVGPVVTWESVLDAYEVVGPAHWIAVLQTALARYEDLRSRGVAFGTNCDAWMTGTDIIEAHGAGDLDYTHIGRKGGLDGSRLRQDLDSGNWRTRLYEVRYEPLPGNDNWFAITDFIERTAH